MNKKVLFIIDPDNLKNSIDLLDVAMKIYPEHSLETFGLVPNKDIEKATGYFNFLLDINLKDEDCYDTMAITDYVEKKHQEYNFDAILLPATFIGRMLAPRIAMRLHTGLVADVTDLNCENGQIEMIRPAFTGKIMAGIENVGKGPIMMTVRQNVFHFEGTPDIESIILPESDQFNLSQKIKILEIEEKPVSYDIRDSEVLISGGGGAKQVFHRLQDLANLLGGNVSASRKIVDQGLTSRAFQVGQSGKTVAPKLYIALGIDGAIQHVEGLKNVEHIISVNLNKNAPISALADIVVQGDATEFVEKLIERINQSTK